MPNNPQQPKPTFKEWPKKIIKSPAPLPGQALKKTGS